MPVDQRLYLKGSSASCSRIHGDIPLPTGTHRRALQRAHNTGSEDQISAACDKLPLPSSKVGESEWVGLDLNQTAQASRLDNSAANTNSFMISFAASLNGPSASGCGGQSARPGQPGTITSEGGAAEPGIGDSSVVAGAGAEIGGRDGGNVCTGGGSVGTVGVGGISTGLNCACADDAAANTMIKSSVRRYETICFPRRDRDRQPTPIMSAKEAPSFISLAMARSFYPLRTMVYLFTWIWNRNAGQLHTLILAAQSIRADIQSA